MVILRSLVFQLCFFSATLVLGVVMLPALLMPPDVLHWGHRLWGRMTAFLLRTICNIEWRVIGSFPPRGGGYIAAGKHQSAWETLVLTLVFERPVFVLKKELNWLPIVGWYSWKMGMIPIDRGAGSKAVRKMLAASKKALEEGHPILIFPEGTRVAPGESAPLQPGVAALYRQLDVPVWPFALNSGTCWPRNSFLRTPGTITVSIEEPIAPGLGKTAFLKELETSISNGMAALDGPATQ